LSGAPELGQSVGSARKAGRSERLVYDRKITPMFLVSVSDVLPQIEARLPNPVATHVAHAGERKLLRGHQKLSHGS
jgi:hypothetical protein